MRPAITLTLMLLVTGCVILRPEERPSPGGEAVCSGLEQPARNHAAALASDGGPSSVQTGANLIRGLAAACVYDLGRAG